jgi:hypothetical protein
MPKGKPTRNAIERLFCKIGRSIDFNEKIADKIN